MGSRNKNNNNINFVSVETDCTTDSGVDSEPSPSSPDSDTGSGSPRPTEGSDSPFPDRTDSPQPLPSYPGDNSKPILPERSDDVSKLSVQCETLRTPESNQNLNKKEVQVIMTPNNSSLQSNYNGSLSSLDPGLEDDKMETVEALLSLSDTSRSPGGSPDKTMITILPAHNPDNGIQYLISFCLQLLPSPSIKRIHLISLHLCSHLQLFFPSSI